MPVPQRLRNLNAIDYVVLFGGPAAFLLVAWFGLMALAGPAPRPNPIKLLKDGAVTAGMPVDTVLAKLGKPTAIRSKEDGSYVLYYHRTSMDGSSLSSDEAQVDVSPTGSVTGIRFDRSTPPELETSGKAD